MGWRLGLIHIALIGASCAAVGCKRPRELEERKQLLQVPSAIEQAKTHVERTRLYDDKGALEPSDEVIAGLRLPRGLKLRMKRERRWVYETDVPIEKLRAYFGPRLDTGSVSPSGGAVTFEHARARDSQGEIYFDVVIGQRPAKPSEAFVDIRQHKPVPTHSPSDEEVRRKIAEKMARAE